MLNFIQQAYKGKNDWWRFLITIFIVFIGWQVIGIIPLFAVALAETNNIGELIEASADAFASLGINSNLYLFVMIHWYCIQ